MSVKIGQFRNKAGVGWFVVLWCPVIWKKLENHAFWTKWNEECWKIHDMARLFYGDVDPQLFLSIYFSVFSGYDFVFLRFCSVLWWCRVKIFLDLRFRVFLRFSPVLTDSVFCTTSSYEIELRTVEKGSNQAFWWS